MKSSDRATNNIPDMYYLFIALFLLARVQFRIIRFHRAACVLLVIMVWLNLSNSFCRALMNQLIVTSQTMRTERKKNKQTVRVCRWHFSNVTFSTNLSRLLPNLDGEADGLERIKAKYEKQNKKKNQIQKQINIDNKRLYENSAPPAVPYFLYLFFLGDVNINGGKCADELLSDSDMSSSS